MQSSLVFVRP